MEFIIPARGLIGFRSEMLTETRGTAQIHSVFAGYEPWCGEIAHRTAGFLVADKPGTTTSYAIYDLQERGRCSSARGRGLRGMVIGETPARRHERHPTKEKKKTNIRTHAADEALRLVPPRQMSLEQALEFIAATSWSRSRRRTSGCASGSSTSAAPARLPPGQEGARGRGAGGWSSIAHICAMGP